MHASHRRKPSPRLHACGPRCAEHACPATCLQQSLPLQLASRQLTLCLLLPACCVPQAARSRPTRPTAGASARSWRTSAVSGGGAQGMAGGQQAGGQGAETLETDTPSSALTHCRPRRPHLPCRRQRLVGQAQHPPGGEDAPQLHPHLLPGPSLLQVLLRAARGRVERTAGGCSTARVSRWAVLSSLGDGSRVGKRGRCGVRAGLLAALGCCGCCGLRGWRDAWMGGRPTPTPTPTHPPTHPYPLLACRCIPVIIQDNVHLAFETALDYR